MPAGSAINEIFQMRKQGLSNNQIIQNLQRQGYSNTQIFDGMNQADTKIAVEGVEHGFIQQPEEFKNEGQELFTQPPPEIERQQTSQVKNIFQDNVKIEELVEAIIEEKWVDLVNDVNKIVEWKNRIEAKISELDVELRSIKENFSDLNQAVLGKVNEYDKHILEIGTDIKAMEKVFSKVLPAFTDNVNELSRIANKLKEKGGVRNEKGPASS